MNCDKCREKLTHFSGFTAKYSHLCKPCYDQELAISSEAELRTSKR